MSRNFVFIISGIAQIISFVCGTCLTWSSPILTKLNGTDDNPLGVPVSTNESSWLGSLLTVGAIFGSFFFGLAAGKVGRKPVLIFLGFPLMIGFIILAVSKNIWFFYFSRILSGVAMGGVFAVMPMYIGEIAEDSNRGILGAAMNCFLTLGLLVSVSLGPYLSFTYFHIILAIFPSLFIILFIIFCPESPYYLIERNYSKAEESLRLIRGKSDVSNELLEIRSTVKKSEGGSVIDIIRDKGLRKGFLIGAGLIFFQQFSGINIVLFYGQILFTQANISGATGPIIISSVQFGTSFITPFLADRSGRKILLMISHIGMMIVELLLGFYFFLEDNGTNVSNVNWLPILFLVLYIIAYNTGSGPIPWALLGELFPSNVKDLAASGVSAVCWICGFLITLEFQSVKAAIGMGQTFWLFSGFGVLAIVFVYFYAIETKGKSFQQIQEDLRA